MRGPLQTGAGPSSASSSAPQQSRSDPPLTPRSPGIWTDSIPGASACSQGVGQAPPMPLTLHRHTPHQRLSPRPPLQTPREPTHPPQNLHHQECAAMGGRRSTPDPLRVRSCSGTFLKVRWRLGKGHRAPAHISGEQPGGVPQHRLLEMMLRGV